jgi:uncharacterized protein (TIGR00297 family)
MEPFSIKATLMATAVAVLMCLRAIKRKSLTTTGAMAAFCVGFLSVITGLRGFCLLIFYQIGTTATKYKKQVKVTKDATFAIQSARGASQVFAVSVIAVILSLVHAIYFQSERAIDYVNDPLASSLTCAIVGHHACCLADTLASELGILSKSPPILITQPWRSVPAGTNGGVTLWGTLCSAIGGGIMGLATVAMDYLSGLAPLNVTSLIMLGTVCGLVGSLIDSILGATIQETFYDDDKKLVYHSEEKPKTAKLVSGINILSNEQVNFVSVAITTWLGGWVFGPMIFGK